MFTNAATVRIVKINKRSVEISYQVGHEPWKRLVLAEEQSLNLSVGYDGEFS